MTCKRASRLILCALFLFLFVGTVPVHAQALPTPESVLGHKPGDDFFLASYDESLAYFKKLAAATDKMKLEQVGKTSEGLDFYIAIISSPENLKNAEKYREMARRIAEVKGLDEAEARRIAREGKAIVHIDGGLHSTEAAGGQHTIQLAYNLISGANDPEIRNILDNVILVLWFCINPDGQNMVANWYRKNVGTPYEISPLPGLYGKYVGHDNNRDGYMNNMLESQIVTRVTVREWYPMVFYNHHQVAPFPARIWIPPFAEPVSTNMHPLMWRWTNVFGTAMAAYLDEHGMPGSIHRTRFDNWYPGFIDNVNNYRNTISFLTETALYSYATPHFYTVRDFPKEFQELRKEVFYSSPWAGGWWRLGDAVRYMIGASMSVLDTAAKFKEQIIYNRYQAGHDVVQQFTKEPPYAYLIPQRQRDLQTAVHLLQKLQQNGIEISQAAQPLQANGRQYPAGTWVILMNQPFALLVKDLFEVQRYPDLRETPGGAPDLPYDIAGWTLPMMMGVEVAAVTSPLSPDFSSIAKAVEKIAITPGTVEGTGSTYIFDHDANVSLRAVNRILKGSGTVALANREISAGNAKFPAGAFVVSGIPAERMQTLAAEFGLKVQAIQKASEPVTQIKAPRVGVYGSWQGNMDEGWTRWLLEQFEFPFAILRNADIQAGHLKDLFDVVLFAEQSTEGIMEGNRIGTTHGQYVGGIGEQGLAQLQEFVKSGGTLITLGNASAFAIDKFGLPVKNVLRGLKNEEFFCSGSILKTAPKEGGHPVLYGLAPEPAVFFDRNGVFEPQPNFRGTVLLSFPKEENPLLSGYLLHPEKIQGKAAALDVFYGRGHVLLTGFRPQWRGQTHGMYKFLFNSLFYFGANAATAPAVTPDPPMVRWSKITEALHAELQKAFEQAQKNPAARRAESLAEVQAAQVAAIDEFKQAVAPRVAPKLDSFKDQIKAAFSDLQTKELARLSFKEWLSQQKLGAFEQEIAETLKAPSP